MERSSHTDEMSEVTAENPIVPRKSAINRSLSDGPVVQGSDALRLLGAIPLQAQVL